MREPSYKFEPNDLDITKNNVINVNITQTMDFGPAL